jgi:hypothetical protein
MKYEANEFDSVGVSRPSDGDSGFFKVMEFDMDDLTVDMVSLSPALDARDEVSGSGNVEPVLENEDRILVRSPRNIDANSLADRFDINGDSTLHDRSVSNLNNISFDGYVTFTTTPPPPPITPDFVQAGSRANDQFLRFLSGAIPASAVNDRCADGDGCSITLTRVYGATTTVYGPCDFSNDPASNTFPILASNCSVIGTGINANGGAISILGSQSNTNCWFSDWDTSGNTGNGDQNGNFAVIIWNTTATNLTCTIRIED